MAYSAAVKAALSALAGDPIAITLALNHSIFIKRSNMGFQVSRLCPWVSILPFLAKYFPVYIGSNLLVQMS